MCRYIAVLLIVSMPCLLPGQNSNPTIDSLMSLRTQANTNLTNDPMLARQQIDQLRIKARKAEQPFF